MLDKQHSLIVTNYDVLEMTWQNGDKINGYFG